jgi:excinuclease ABC subunit C
MKGSARDQAALLPLAPGVYRFRDATGRVLYLGRATSLRSRVASYWGDLGGRAHLGRMMARVVRVEAVACDSVHEAAWLERRLWGTSPRATMTVGVFRGSRMCSQT